MEPKEKAPWEWIVILIAIVIAAAIAGGCPAQAAPILTGVWAVDQVQSPAGNPWGSNQAVPSQALANVSEIKRDGFTGVIVDTFIDCSLAAQVYTQCDVDNLKAIPVLDLSGPFQSGQPPGVLEADATQAVQRYIAFAAVHPSAYKSAGKIIMFVFGAYQMSGDQWTAALGQFAGQVLFIGDGSGPGPWTSTYSFWAGTSGVGTTVMPAYHAPGVTKRWFDYSATNWASAWQSAIAAKSPCIIVCTFDDYHDLSSILLPPGCEALTVKMIAAYKRAR